MTVPRRNNSQTSKTAQTELQSSTTVIHTKTSKIIATVYKEEMNSPNPEIPNIPIYVTVVSSFGDDLNLLDLIKNANNSDNTIRSQIEEDISSRNLAINTAPETAKDVPSNDSSINTASEIKENAPCSNSIINTTREIEEIVPSSDSFMNIAPVIEKGVSSSNSVSSNSDINTELEIEVVPSSDSCINTASIIEKGVSSSNSVSSNSVINTALEIEEVVLSSDSCINTASVIEKGVSSNNSVSSNLVINTALEIEEVLPSSDSCINTASVIEKGVSSSNSASRNSVINTTFGIEVVSSSDSNINTAFEIGKGISSSNSIINTAYGIKGEISTSFLPTDTQSGSEDEIPPSSSKNESHDDSTNLKNVVSSPANTQEEAAAIKQLKNLADTSVDSTSKERNSSTNEETKKKIEPLSNSQNISQVPRHARSRSGGRRHRRALNSRLRKQHVSKDSYSSESDTSTFEEQILHSVDLLTRYLINRTLYTDSEDPDSDNEHYEYRIVGRPRKRTAVFRARNSGEMTIICHEGSSSHPETSITRPSSFSRTNGFRFDGNLLHSTGDTHNASTSAISNTSFISTTLADGSGARPTRQSFPSHFESDSDDAPNLEEEMEIPTTTQETASGHVEVPVPTSVEQNTVNSVSSERSSSTTNTNNKGTEPNNEISFARSEEDVCSRMKCPVCLNTKKQLDRSSRYMMVVDCGHVVCNKCTERLLTTRKRCPICRKTITEKDTKRIYF